MFERYTERARRTLFFARYEASELGSRAIGSEHLLLGLILDFQGRAAQLLLRAHLPIEHIRSEIERAVVFEEKIPTSVEIPFSGEVKRILERAATEADGLNSAAIDTEHLLIAILRSERSLAASVLIKLGMDADTVREDLVHLQREATASGSAPLAQPNVDVRIVPTRRREPGISSRGGLSSLDLEGFTLRAALSRVCSLHESRIDLQAPVDEEARYDMSAVWPPGHTHESGHGLIREGIARLFGVTIAYEPQWLDVYVLTALEGALASAAEAQSFGGGGIGFATADYMSTGPIGEPPRLGSGSIITGLSASNATMEEFCHDLEDTGLDRLVVDETNLQGRFTFSVRGHASTIDELWELLHAQLRLVLTPAQRDVLMLVVRPNAQ